MKYSKNVVRSLTLITQFSINMLVPVMLCTFLGIFLDRIFSTSFIVIILFFVGALAGFTNIFRLARSIYSKSEDKHINYYQINNKETSVPGDEDTKDDKEAVIRK